MIGQAMRSDLGDLHRTGMVHHRDGGMAEESEHAGADNNGPECTAQATPFLSGPLAGARAFGCCCRHCVEGFIRGWHSHR
jgi:hypothetical protein